MLGTTGRKRERGTGGYEERNKNNKNNEEVRETGLRKSFRKPTMHVVESTSTEI